MKCQRRILLGAICLLFNISPSFGSENINFESLRSEFSNSSVLKLDDLDHDNPWTCDLICSPGFSSRRSRFTLRLGRPDLEMGIDPSSLDYARRFHSAWMSGLVDRRLVIADTSQGLQILLPGGEHMNMRLAESGRILGEMVGHSSEISTEYPSFFGDGYVYSYVVCQP